MKKLLLTLGALAAVAAPVAAVVACGNTTTNEDQGKAAIAAPVTISPTTDTPNEIVSNVETTKEKQTPELSASEVLRLAISKATPEDIANHLTYQGRQMKYFYVITKIDDADTFDVLETHNWGGSVVSYTNKLVKSDSEAGTHDLVLNADFDTSKLKPGMVIGQEDIKDQTYVTQKTNKDGIHKFFIINQDLKLDEDFSSTEEPISSGIVEPLPSIGVSSVDEDAKVDLSQIDLDKAIAPAMTSGLISRDKLAVIKAAWDIFEEKVNTVKDFIELTRTLAYPGNPSSSIRANVKAWVEKVLDGAKKEVGTSTDVTTVSKGILQGYDVDTVTGTDILGRLISKHKLQGIKDNWADLTKMNDKDELISKIGALSYGDNLNSQEIEHIGQWIEKILATEPTANAAVSETKAPVAEQKETSGDNSETETVSEEIDLSNVDINTVLGKEYTLNLISSKKSQVIIDGWDTVVATAKTLQDLADQVTELAYPGTTDKHIKANVLKWAKRVLGLEPLEQIVQSPWAYVPYNKD